MSAGETEKKIQHQEDNNRGRATFVRNEAKINFLSN